MFLAVINEFKGEKAKEDRSGNLPLILNVLGGKCPNKRMISLGWADTQEMEVGKTYLIEAVELEPSAEYGRQFQFNKVREASLVEIAEYVEKFPRKIYDVSSVKTGVSEEVFNKQSEEA